MRIGGSDADWQPHHSNYAGYREYAGGTGWKVWVGLPGNPRVRHVRRNGSLPVPDYREPTSITVPDTWLN